MNRQQFTTLQQQIEQFNAQTEQLSSHIDQVKSVMTRNFVEMQIDSGGIEPEFAEKAIEYLDGLPNGERQQAMDKISSSNTTFGHGWARESFRQHRQIEQRAKRSRCSYKEALFELSAEGLIDI